MSFRKEGNLIVFRFEDGKDIIESLKRIAKEHQIQSGVILGGIGMLRDFEISFYSREKSGYVTNKFNEPVELLSLSGNISLRNNEIFFHVHVALAKEDKGAIGGHLKKATVHNTLEGVIAKFSEIKLMRDPENSNSLHIVIDVRKGERIYRSICLQEQLVRFALPSILMPCPSG